MPIPGARISVAGEYQTLAGAISSYKDGGIRSLRGFLIQRLVRAVTVHGLSRPVLVPVPSSHGSIRRRGVDLTAKLAADTATVIGVTSVPALRWSSRRQMQKKLDARERQRNMFQALNADKDILPSRGSIIVVDDVLTTGATMGAALAALRNAGVSADWGSVICATRQNLTETFSSSGR